MKDEDIKTSWVGRGNAQVVAVEIDDEEVMAALEKRLPDPPAEINNPPQHMEFMGCDDHVPEWNVKAFTDGPPDRVQGFHECEQSMRPVAEGLVLPDFMAGSLRIILEEGHGRGILSGPVTHIGTHEFAELDAIMVLRSENTPGPEWARYDYVVCKAEFAKAGDVPAHAVDWFHHDEPARDSDGWLVTATVIASFLRATNPQPTTH